MKFEFNVACMYIIFIDFLALGFFHQQSERSKEHFEVCGGGNIVNSSMAWYSITQHDRPEVTSLTPLNIIDAGCVFMKWTPRVNKWLHSSGY
jgi:hypothetical protein